MKVNKLAILGFITMACAIIFYLMFSYFSIRVIISKKDILSCTSNINFNLSDGVSPGPIIDGGMYLNLKSDGSGFTEISGVVKWQDETYPISKRINIKHDLNRAYLGNLVTIHAVSSLSLEHDKSPKGLIETYLVGDPSQPARILRIKKLYDNGYVISNLNSPVTICIDR